MERNELLRKITQHLTILYDDCCPGGMAEQIVQICEDHRVLTTTTAKWDEKDAILITYPDSIVKQGYSPLFALNKFADKYLKERISCIHILPFYPSSSDGGFAVMDYQTVSKKLGNWDDISTLSTKFDLMFDFVGNHVSQHSKWFTDYTIGKDGAAEYFIESAPGRDSPTAMRPGTNSLLTEVNTADGIRHVWSTFTDDQIDLNYKNPEVLFEMILVMAHYLQKQARTIRIGAAAYLWKENGTGNMHLPQTHELIKLFRTVAEAINQRATIVADCNGTDTDNISYCDGGDEAHIVYQNNLPCLLLHAFHTGTATYLSQWIRQQPEIKEGCTFLNITATHDGITLPQEDTIIPPSEMQEMIEAKKTNGGLISVCTLADGSERPFELNMSYFDALRSIQSGEDGMQAKRFICAQAIAMSLKGIPAIYIHSLLATSNDYDSYLSTGQQRNLHRKQLNIEDIRHLLRISWHPTKKIFYRLLELLEIRRQQPAFNPDATQESVKTESSLFAIIRKSEQQKLIIIANLTNKAVKTDLHAIAPGHSYTDITDGACLPNEITINPYAYLWIELGHKKNC